MANWLLLGGMDQTRAAVAKEFATAIKAEDPSAKLFGTSSAGPELFAASDEAPACLRDVVDANGKLEPYSYARHRATLAALSVVDSIIVIAPATEADWFELGMVFGLRGARTVRMALLLMPSQRRDLRCWPGVIQHADLITEEPARIVSWISGRLFKDLLPVGLRKPERRRQVEPPEH